MNLFEIKANYLAGRITKQEYIDQMHQVHAGLFEYAEFLHQTDICKIEIADGQVVMEARESGVKILCDKVDKRIAPVEALNFGSYEKADSDMMFRLLQNRRTIFDIGANIGWYSLHFAKAFPNAQIFAFEPIPATYGYLKRNIALNQASNVHASNFGFSDHEGELVFYFHKQGSGSASAADLMGTGVAERIQCPVKTLDDFMGEISTGPNFIKCDVEGAELFVLKGGVNTLKHHRPIVFAEMLRKWSAKFNYHPNQIIEFMASLGYHCYVRKTEKLARFFRMDENTEATNFFFMHPEAHAGEIKTFVEA